MEKTMLWFSRRLLYLIILMLGILLLWSYFCKLPVTVASRCVLMAGEATDRGGQHLMMTVGAEKIGEVRSGMRVLVRLDLLPYQQYGSLEGVVTGVEKVPSIFTSDGSPRYQVMIALDSVPEKLEKDLQPGMQGQAEIITGEQRILSQLF